MSAMQRRCSRRVCAAALGLLAVAGVESAFGGYYQLESELLIPSETAPNWDYLAFDELHHALYIARREDGVLIYDTQRRKITGALPNTAGGNATTLVPELDRIFVTNLDGSLTVIRHSNRQLLDRVAVGTSADNAFYEPVTKQLVVTMGDDKQMAFVDARTAKVLGKLTLDSEKLEGTAPDGQGRVYMALRDRNKVLQIDVAAQRVTAEFVPEDCVLPNGVAYDAASKRIFVSCRGEHPIIAVLDESGRTVAKPEIGRGNDILIYDPAAHRLLTSNGFDGTLVAISQVDANTYRLESAVTTRPYARTMALDPKSGRVYLVTADGRVDPSKKWKRDIAPFYPNTYFKNTFRLLTYALK
jgi:DNA-binding beta-propeller fold protein YncE